MSMWSVAFIGSTPIGSPIVGWITAQAGARIGLAVGGMACLVAAAFGLIAFRRLQRRRTPQEALPPAEDLLAA